MSTIEINIVVAADPTENVHSSIKADGIEIWETGPMPDRAISDLQAERMALPPSHWPQSVDGAGGPLGAPDVHVENPGKHSK